MSIPYQASRIHPSHELENIDSVGHCKLCLEAWVGEVMTPGLLSACTMVKPEIDPMTGHPVEFMEREGFGQQVVDAMNRQPASGFAIPYIEVSATIERTAYDASKD